MSKNPNFRLTFYPIFGNGPPLTNTVLDFVNISERYTVFHWYRWDSHLFFHQNQDNGQLYRSPFGFN
jgi:hypothetical protein